MKKIALAALFLCSFTIFAQDPALAPFYHGVASGDPTSDAVIIWTRVSDTSGTISLDWKMATDTMFCNVVKSGTTSTDTSKDFTAKVDVTGLQANTWYYYQFMIDGKNSLIGRTKTLPTGNNQRVRLAVASCSNYGSGTYFNAYLSIARRNDIDAVVHLGDYIYEYGGGGTSGTGIQILPANEILTLDDYRMRYSSYRLDPHLRLLHQQYPFYTVWDDHETANNSWSGGAENHTTGTEGDWETRKTNGKRANFDWLPKRKQAPGDYTIYRTFSIGNLADLILLDTRLEGRDEQATTTTGYQDTSRTIMGTTQRQWFFDQLQSSTAKWKIVGQQVMIAPLISTTFTNDMWDGYVGDRNRFISHVLDNNIENVVVLTGDIHSSWASDIPGPGYNSSTGAGAAFVEFVCSSITSGGLPIPIDAQTIQGIAPHIKYVDLTQRGYLILDIDSNRAQSDWVYVSSITNATFTENNSASWFVNEGERFVREAASPASAFVNSAPFAPSATEDMICTGVENVKADNGISVFPNPFDNSISVQLKHHNGVAFTVKLFNVLGEQVLDVKFDGSSSRVEVDTHLLPAGSYLLTVDALNMERGMSVVKLK